MTERVDQRTYVPDQDPGRPLPLDWNAYSDACLSQWFGLLSQDPEESAVQAFLELHPAMVPGGSGDIGPGGHHGSQFSAVFRTPRLLGAGREFEPDFMWITRSTGLITPILIEIEKPAKRWFQANGRPTADFRDAHDQLNDWRSWFERDGNRSSFRERYMFGDKYHERPIEPQYVLVYGRNSEFEAGGGHINHADLRAKRDTQRGPAEVFMTFDSLRPRYDHGSSMTLTMTAAGPRPFAFSPVFGTDTDTGSEALILGDPSEALERSVMMSADRKRYIAQRWDHWKRVELEVRESDAMHIRQMGRE